MMRLPGAVKDPQTKEIKAGSTIALAFDQFQTMHLTLRLAIAVFEREPRAAHERILGNSNRRRRGMTRSPSV